MLRSPFLISHPRSFPLTTGSSPKPHSITVALPLQPSHSCPLLSSPPHSFHGAQTLPSLAWTLAVDSCPLALLSPPPGLSQPPSPAVLPSCPRCIISSQVSWMIGQTGDREGSSGGRGRIGEEAEIGEKQGGRERLRTGERNAVRRKERQEQKDTQGEGDIKEGGERRGQNIDKGT